MITTKVKKCKVRGERKYRLAVVNHGTATMDNVVSVMTLQSTVTRPDAVAVVNALQRRIEWYLQQGYHVNVGELGIFQLRVKTKGANRFEEFKADNILATHVTFVPHTALRQAIALGAPGISLRNAGV